MNARELVEKIKKSSDYNEVTIPLAHLHQEFLLRVIEAAVSVAAIHFNSDESDFKQIENKVWNRIDQRLAEGESKEANPKGGDEAERRLLK